MWEIIRASSAPLWTSFHRTKNSKMDLLRSFLLVICLTSGMVLGQETNINESEKDFEKEFNIK